VALLGEAHRALPADVALREQFERAGGSASDRAAWLMERVNEAGDGGALALEAAFLFELDGDMALASRCLGQARSAPVSPLVEPFALRLALCGQAVDAVIDRYSSALRQASAPTARRDLAAMLAQLESRGRGDRAAAIRCWREALEADPTDLLTLLEAERLLFEEQDRAALATIELAIARALSGAQSVAHAMLAARMASVVSGGSDASFEAVKVAARANPKHVWALRHMALHCHARGLLAGYWRACADLAEQSDRPLERATLLCRAAEGAVGAGDCDSAMALSTEALSAYPQHIIARLLRASLLERRGEVSAAAEAYEQLGAMSRSRRERAERLYKAATLWLASDQPRATSEGRRLLEAVCELDGEHANAFERLQAIYLAGGAKMELAELLSQRARSVSDPHQRGEFEVLRGRMLAEAGAAGEAKAALLASLKARPDDLEAWRAYADVCLTDGDWDAAEPALLQLGRLLRDARERADVYLRLAGIYHRHRPNPERAMLSLREAIKLDPNRIDVREQLVDLQVMSGDFAGALVSQRAMCDETLAPALACARAVKLALIHEQAGNQDEAERVLTQLRRDHPKEPAPLRALYDLYHREGKPELADTLLERAAADVQRSLAAGRFEEPLFVLSVAVAEMRGQHDLATASKATLAAIAGQPAATLGGGFGAADPALDELLAPEVFSLGLRKLLAATGTLIEAAAPFDLRSLRAKPPSGHDPLLARTRQIAAAYGVLDVEVVVTGSLGTSVVAASLEPPVLCFGNSVLELERGDLGEFLIHRAVKLLQTRTAVFARTAPIDLWPMLAAYLKVHDPGIALLGADPGKVEDYYQRMHALGGRAVDPQLKLVASEVAQSIGNRAANLHASACSWGSRTALLAMGDPYLALDAIAVANNQSMPLSTAERLRWITRQAEARDLVAFSISDAYASLRARLGLANVPSDARPESDITLES
jgi:tetratricopeptide (TPR) repeat protein